MYHSDFALEGSRDDGMDACCGVTLGSGFHGDNSSYFQHHGWNVLLGEDLTAARVVGCLTGGDLCSWHVGRCCHDDPKA